MHSQPKSNDHIDVQTTAGIVRGLRREGSATFLGIPFAEPPIGELRFAAPVPHRPWEGVRDAVQYGPTPQRAALSEVTLIPEPSIPGESTLLVNVFTPNPVRAESGGLPVLVYVHGGGFVAGSPASPWYDGAAFNRDGVITVTVSYRLGFDGFGWIADAPHNRGVLDWLLALEWVQDNIRFFGGDPTRVTIAGQSAGGAAVLTLLGMPLAQGLFSRVYCISGPIANTSLATAEALGRQLAELANVEPTRAGLAQLTEARVLELQGQISTIGNPASADADPLAGLISLASNGMTLGPVIDGNLIPLPTLEALRNGIGADKELVMGATDHEFNLVLTADRDGLAAVPPATILGRMGVSETTTAAYLTDHPDLDTAGVVGQYLTDHMFRAAAVRAAEARGPAATWLYRFSWHSPAFGEAVHCLDMPFFFDCLDADAVSAIAGSKPPQILADEVHGAAVAFIRQGNPEWPKWSREEPVTRVFDAPSSVAVDGFADVRSLLTVPV